MIGGKKKNSNGVRRSHGTTRFLPLHAIAMERSCRRMASVCPSICLSVTLVSADHIRWARWNFITRL